MSGSNSLQYFQSQPHGMTFFILESHESQYETTFSYSEESPDTSVFLACDAYRLSDYFRTFYLAAYGLSSEGLNRIKITPSGYNGLTYYCFLKGATIVDSEGERGLIPSAPRPPKFANASTLTASIDFPDLTMSFNGGAHFFKTFTSIAPGQLDRTATCKLSKLVGEEKIDLPFEILFNAMKSFSITPKPSSLDDFTDVNAKYELDCPGILETKVPLARNSMDYIPLVHAADILSQDPLSTTPLPASQNYGTSVPYLSSTKMEVYSTTTKCRYGEDISPCLDEDRMRSCETSDDTCKCEFPITISECQQNYRECQNTNSFTPERCDCEVYPELTLCRQMKCEESSDPEDCCLSYEGSEEQCQDACVTNYKQICCAFMYQESKCDAFEQKCDEDPGFSPHCNCATHPSSLPCLVKQCLNPTYQESYDRREKCCHEKMDPKYCLFHTCKSTDAPDPEGKCKNLGIRCLNHEDTTEQCQEYRFCNENPEHEECQDKKYDDDHDPVTAGVSPSQMIGFMSSCLIFVFLLANYAM